MKTLTISQAKAAHKTAEVFDIIDRTDADGETKPAIYVWATEADAKNDDGGNAVAVYWHRDAEFDDVKKLVQEAVLDGICTEDAEEKLLLVDGDWVVGLNDAVDEITTWLCNDGADDGEQWMLTSGDRLIVGGAMVQLIDVDEAKKNEPAYGVVGKEARCILA